MSETALYKAIHRLAESLAEEARAGNWRAVHDLDAKVRRLLGSGPVPPALRPALDGLKEAHTMALELARTEAGRLQERIETLGRNREGLRAYEQSRSLHDFL